MLAYSNELEIQLNSGILHVQSKRVDTNSINLYGKIMYVSVCRWDKCYIFNKMFTSRVFYLCFQAPNQPLRPDLRSNIFFL